MPGPANDNASPRETVTVARPCPICGKPASLAARPFCSKRCADLDLHRWLGGTYRVSGADHDDEDELPETEP